MEYERQNRLLHVVEEAAHLLPAQGPIETFIHHNTLHAFQHLPFHDAVAKAGRVFDCEGYLTEAQYRSHYASGRIRESDLESALDEWDPKAGRVLTGSVTARMVHRLALLHPIEADVDFSLSWRLEERHAFREFLPYVREESRLRFTDASARWLNTCLERVGLDWTLTDLADALLGGALVTYIQKRVADFAGPTQPAEVRLAQFEIPAERRSNYVARIAACLPASAPKEYVATWLALEHECVLPVLRELWGTDPDWASLKRKLSEHPGQVSLRALWGACQAPFSPLRTIDGSDNGSGESIHEVLRDLTGEDPSDLVNPPMIRWSAAFLDEGVARWEMPGRQHGFFAAWRALSIAGTYPTEAWLASLKSELESHPGSTALGAILRYLDDFGISEEQWQAHITRALLELPGWAGMFHWLEQHPARSEYGPPSLIDYLAVRLMYSRFAALEVARRHLGYAGDANGLREFVDGKMRSRRSKLNEERASRPEIIRLNAAFRLFQLAQLAGLTSHDIVAAGSEGRHRLLRELDGFDELSRRRVWQEAYEGHLRNEIVHALVENTQRPITERQPEPAAAQIAFCIDDRECSLRRHIEERFPRYETLGVAGFFGVAIRFRGLDEISHTPLCPVVVDPNHDIEEECHPEDASIAELRRRVRSRRARVFGALQEGSRSLLSGTMVTLSVGWGAAIVLLLRVLFPRTASKLLKWANARTLPAPRTVLRRLRGSVEEVDARASAGRVLGFTVREQAERVLGTLENMGLTKRLSGLVVLLGHGAHSVNNPHQSAYDCGACGGRNGGPNARLFAEMANNPDVRSELGKLGLVIPGDTLFVGGVHNTTTDEITFFDVDGLSSTHRRELETLRRALDDARAWSAHERCRRFASAPKNPTPEQALRHVEERAEDLSQARPELGHVTNASCVVGRRALTRGIFFDRRAFLVSYDPTEDATGAVLERILVAVGPVCAGISLEYYFSSVDNQRYGAGTKLPHNLSTLLGVMDGAQSDLRVGLPKQMVEIHEPVRLLMIIESSPERLWDICERQAVLKELAGNAWVQLVTLCPDTARTFRYTRSGFVEFHATGTKLPEVRFSPEWYRGHSEFLPPAIVRGAMDNGNRNSPSDRRDSVGEHHAAE